MTKDIQPTEEQKRTWLDWLNSRSTDLSNRPLKDMCHEDRLCYTADVLLDTIGFVTYDEGLSAKMAVKYVPALKAMLDGDNFKYIRADDENEETLITLASLLHAGGFSGWGTSIRGAWVENEKDEFFVDLIGSVGGTKGMVVFLRVMIEEYERVLKVYDDHIEEMKRTGGNCQSNLDALVQATVQIQPQTAS